MTLEEKSYKFRGGLWIGLLANSWPSGVLEVAQNSLILRDEMFKKEYKFSKEDIVEIKIKKVFPIIGYGIRLIHTNQNYNSEIYFWYWSFRFDQLINALKECGWLK